MIETEINALETADLLHTSEMLYCDLFARENRCSLKKKKQKIICLDIEKKAFHVLQKYIKRILPMYYTTCPWITSLGMGLQLRLFMCQAIDK